MADKSYAQYDQDKHVVEFYRGATGGTFVDIGAFDGIFLSNTYKLETEFGWNGICIEPLKDKFDLCRSRRQATCVNAVLSASSGETVNFVRPNSGRSFLAGISSNLDGWGKELAMSGEQVTMQTRSLTDILDENNAPHFIHYMSLDTEGSEMDILRGTNFDRYTFGYICLEHNHIEPRRSEMRELLEKHGYCHYIENECDDDYYHRSIVSGTYFYRKNFDKPIRIELLDEHIVKASSDYWPDDYGVFYPQELKIRFDTLGTRMVSGSSIEASARDQWNRHPQDLALRTE